jgi:hypothetical protein
MKKVFFLSFCLSLYLGAHAIEIHTVATTPGHLYTDAGTYLKTVTNLTVTGTIDARDFGTMRNYMSRLSVVDLSGVTIAAYTDGRKTFRENEIPTYAFNNCETLTSVTMPAKMTSIGIAAFYGCTGLTGELTIPSGLIAIGDYAFFNCIALSAVTIPSSVVTVGYQAFGYCSSLTGIMIPSSVRSIGDYAFAACKSLTAVTIPSSVTSIGNCAFQDCTGLNTISIPSSVTSIGNYAFDNCVSLTSVNTYGTDPDEITLGSVVFYFVPTSTCNLYVPSETKALYTAAAQWKDFTNKAEMISTSTATLSGKSTDAHPDLLTDYVVVMKK